VEYNGAPWPARDLAAMTYDEARGVIVLFGGSNGAAPLRRDHLVYGHHAPGVDVVLFTAG
jgi:hypothetical protein